jgi:hypothetical protein
MSLLIGTCLFVLLINLKIGLILLLLAAISIAHLPRPHGMTNDYTCTNAWWIDGQGRVEKVTSFGSDPSRAPRHIAIIKKGTRVEIPHTNEQIVFTLDPSEQSVQAMVDLLVLLLSVHRWERRKMLRGRIGIRIDDHQGYTNLGPDGIEIQTITE